MNLLPLARPRTLGDVAARLAALRPLYVLPLATPSVQRRSEIDADAQRVIVARMAQTAENREARR